MTYLNIDGTSGSTPNSVGLRGQTRCPQKMNSPHRIVGAGLFALDVIVAPDGTHSKSALGGSAGNVLSILAALGWSASPVGTIGADEAAEAVQRDFASVGADLQFMRRCTTRHTPVVYQFQTPGDSSTHSFSFRCPACGRDRKPNWEDAKQFNEDRNDLPEASVFFFDRPTPLAVALAEHYARTSALVFFEPSTLGDDPALFSRAVQCADIVKYADDRFTDLREYYPRSDAVEIQTRGADGLRFRAPSLDGDWFSIGAYRLPTICDTAGAGDWCTAGLLFDLLGREPSSAKTIDYNTLARALAFGQVMSSLNCLTEGARGLLSAWSPTRVVRAAAELSRSRMQAFRREAAQIRDHFSEPKLTEIAEVIRQNQSSDKYRAATYLCCTV